MSRIPAFSRPRIPPSFIDFNLMTPEGDWVNFFLEGVRPLSTAKNKKELFSRKYLTSNILMCYNAYKPKKVSAKMNSKLIVKEIMENKGVTNADMANRLNITQAAMWDRLKLKKVKNGQEMPCPNMTVDKLNDMLRALDYEIVIVPRGKSGRIEGAYLVDDTEEKK